MRQRVQKKRMQNPGNTNIPYNVASLKLLNKHILLQIWMRQLHDDANKLIGAVNVGVSTGTLIRLQNFRTCSS